MALERASLLKHLEIVKPAIASKALVEQLTHVWLGNGEVVAYDDIIGIRQKLPFDCPLEGGVNGDLLLGLLNNSRAKEVEFIVDGEEVLLRAAGSKLTLALMRLSDAVYDIPKMPKGAFDIDTEFLAALDKVLVSVGTDTSVPDQLGVTLIQGDGLVDFMTTDSKSLAWVTLRNCDIGVDRVTLPTAFCMQLLKLCKGGGKLGFSSDSVVATNKDGTLLFARTVHVPHPVDFFQVIDNNIPKGGKKNGVPIPTRLRLALERALVLLNGKTGEPVEFSIDRNLMTLYVKVEGRGELRDVMKIEGGDHRDVSLRIDPVLIKRAIESCDTMLLSDQAFVLFGDPKFVYLASSRA